MQVEIISPEKKIYAGDAKLIQLPGSDGSFEIMQDHAPLISSLKAGQVKVIDMEGDIKFFELKGGIIEVLKNKVIVLAEERS